MTATILQVLGLTSIIAGAALTAGAGGALIGSGVVAVFVGLAADR